MAVHTIRKFRNFAAILMLLSGCTHVGQLWFMELSGTALIGALFGMFYLLISLGLAGKSRFTLWIALFLPMLGAFGATLRLEQGQFNPILAWHILADALVVASCAWILFRTRHMEME